jgi:hypothetical protein
MSLGSALTDLRDASTGLEQAVAELVMIVHEDRPAESGIAMIDHLAETVSELQAAAVQATRRVTAITEPRQLAGQLWYVDEAVADGASTYWRELRAFAPVQELRRTASSRGLEWRTWQRSIELSLLRCEAPLLHTTHAVRAAWQEVGELLTHYLPPSPPTPTSLRTEPAPPRTTPDEQPQMSTRRSS